MFMDYAFEDVSFLKISTHTHASVAAYIYC